MLHKLSGKDSRRHNISTRAHGRGRISGRGLRNVEGALGVVIHFVGPYELELSSYLDKLGEAIRQPRGAEGGASITFKQSRFEVGACPTAPIPLAGYISTFRGQANGVLGHSGRVQRPDERIELEHNIL